jgi:Flp pilus assembly protein protease CpaA
MLEFFSYPEIFLVLIGLIWIGFASVQDLRTREVANWLTFSFVLFAIAFRIFYSIFSEQWWFLIQGIIGLGIFFVLAHAFYYGRIFAGGDAKLLIGIGAVLPLSASFLNNAVNFGAFLLLFLSVGAIYGLIWSFFLIFSDLKRFNPIIKEKFSKLKWMLFIGVCFGIFFALLGLFNALFFAFAIIFFLLPYLFLLAKSVDETFMVKSRSLHELREGDWLHRDVRVQGKNIKASWDGLSEEDIALLRGAYGKKKMSVLIKEGIPFVPVFFISYILFIVLYGIDFFKIILNTLF